MRKQRSLSLKALREHLGLPEVGSARPFALAMAIDAIGSGLFLPFSLLYFHRTAGLPLTEVGLGLSIAMLVAVLVPPFAGVLVDRVGPKRIVILTNMARVVGLLGYLLVHNLTTLIGFALLVSVSDRLFWVAQPTLIGQMTSSGNRDRWFGFTTALQAAGLGIGGLLAGLAVSSLDTAGYQALVVANAVSFAIAAALMARLPVATTRAPAALANLGKPKGLRAVLADRPFMGIVLTNLVFGIARTAVLVGLPVYSVEILKVPAWLVGVLYGTYTSLIAFGQTSMVRRLEPHRRTRALMLAAGLWAGSFVLLATAPLLPYSAVVIFLFVVTSLYTVAVMIHVGVIDALVVEAAPDALRGRYVGAYQLSWAVANALAPGLFTSLLAWQPWQPWLGLAALLLLALVGVRWLEPRLTPAAVRFPPGRTP
jgi:MFS family permease